MKGKLFLTSEQGDVIASWDWSTDSSDLEDVDYIFPLKGLGPQFFADALYDEIKMYMG